MSDLELKLQDDKTAEHEVAAKQRGGDKPAWETPRLEDVSEQVMAQPYIRFT